MMPRAVVALVFALTLALTLALLTREDASASDAPRIIARVRCAQPAEDALAHLRMLRYTARNDGSIVAVYRCERAGY